MPTSQSQVPELQSWVPGACLPLATAFVGSPAHPEALVAPVPSSGGPHRPVGSLQLLQEQAQQRTTGGEVDRYLCGTGGTSRVPSLAPVMTFSTPGRLSRPSLSDPILHHSFLPEHVSSLFHLHPFLLLCFFCFSFLFVVARVATERGLLSLSLSLCLYSLKRKHDTAADGGGDGLHDGAHERQQGPGHHRLHRDLRRRSFWHPRPSTLRPPPVRRLPRTQRLAMHCYVGEFPILLFSTAPPL